MPIISKEEFIDYITFIEEQAKKQDKFLEALKEMSPGSYCDCFLYNAYEDKLIDLLQKIMNDTEDDIGYYLYEMSSEESYPRDEKGNILYKDKESLYNFLISKYKEK